MEKFVEVVEELEQVPDVIEVKQKRTNVKKNVAEVKQEVDDWSSMQVAVKQEPSIVEPNNNQLVCYETQQPIVQPTVRKRGRPAKKKNVQQKNVQKKSVIRKKKVEKKKKVGKKNKK